MNLSKNDITFTAIMLLIIAFLSVAIFFNYKIRLDRSTLHEPVGTVTYKNHIVERRYGDRFVWEEISPKSEVFLYDSVLTKDQSDAYIDLKNGLSFDIAANTMIEIDEDGIVLQGGALRARNKGGSKALIRTKDGTVIHLRKGGVRLDKSKKGLNITVTDGELDIKKGDKTQTIKKGDNLNINSKGDVNKTKISINKLKPQDGAIILTSGQYANITLGWQGSSKNYTILVSQTNDFSKSTKTFHSRAAQKNITLPIATWYWRVKSNDGKETSAIQTLKVRAEKKIIVYTPGNNSTVKSKKKKNHRVLFKWKNEGDSAVRLVLSRHRNLKDPIVNKVFRDNQTEVNNLKEDEYYWQISPEFKKGEKKVYSFRIENEDKIIKKEILEKKRQAEEKKQQALQIKAPRLLAPKGRQRLVTGKPLSVVFRWQKSTGANRYYMQIYQLRGRAKIILKQATSSTNRIRFNFTPRNNARRIFWRVKGQRLVNGRVVNETNFSQTSFSLRPSLRPPTVTKVIVKHK